MTMNFQMVYDYFLMKQLCSKSPTQSSVSCQ